MSLKENDSVLSLFYFWIPRMTRPILTSFMRSWITKPLPQIKMSSTLLSQQDFSTATFSPSSVRRDRDAFYQSKADTAPHAPTIPLPRNRKEGPRARASWVGEHYDLQFNWSLMRSLLVLVIRVRLSWQTNRASFDLPEVEAELVASYNVEYAQDAILNSLLLAEAKCRGVSGTHSDRNNGRAFTNFRIFYFKERWKRFTI
ncbi:hypothetical protein M9H77_22766 [Catharanthus roseus]|uniref:Uncharacterized protein n=1 Tax=Catharanthus roseus TaxID=4058 RepID=A0ACC0AVG9_CATRO|nr:hypothetical protein M9H77_22766 [Catharanthus roseus]